jgi:hypothetical protein
MKSLVLCALLVLLLAFHFTRFAQADSWLGNVQVEHHRRSLTEKYVLNSQTIADNLANYSTYTLTFDFFKPGVTNVPGTSPWENADARVELVKDSSQATISSAPISITSSHGHNAVYSVPFDLINPQIVAGMDPELANRGTMHTHLHVIMDGQVMLSVPVDYNYNP